MNYIQYPIKLYIDLNITESILLSTLEESYSIWCNSFEERKIFLYGMLKYILTEAAIRNNIKRLITSKHINHLLELLPQPTIPSKITTLQRSFPSRWRKYEQSHTILTQSITDIQGAY